MIIHLHRFVIELLQRHKVCELGGDKLHRHSGGLNFLFMWSLYLAITLLIIRRHTPLSVGR